jgi:hypothetical protein
MNWRKFFLYTVVGLGLLVAAQIALSVFWTIIGLTWAIATSVITLVVIGAIGYGGVKLLSWYLDFDTRSTTDGNATGAESADTEPDNRIERLKDRYANGTLSEAEFERQLEHELNGSNVDSINRELSREHE